MSFAKRHGEIFIFSIDPSRLTRSQTFIGAVFDLAVMALCLHEKHLNPNPQKCLMGLSGHTVDNTTD